jgi:hypothetical protein
MIPLTPTGHCKYCSRDISIGTTGASGANGASGASGATGLTGPNGNGTGPFEFKF